MQVILQTLKDKFKRRVVSFPTTTTQFFQMTALTGITAKQTQQERSVSLSYKIKLEYTIRA